VHKITEDGVYGPQPRSAMYWPEFDTLHKRWSQ